ncbi:MAG TPA: DinB family protein [bacterium]
MTRELLAAWGVDFEHVNVEGNDEALQELISLGAPLVPAMAYKGQIVHGWNPAAYAKLAGVDFSDVPKLSPADLGKRLDKILELNQAALRITPDNKLMVEGPGRKRALRQLAFHAFRVGASFVDAMEQDGLEEAWLQEEAPKEMTTGPQVAAFGDGVRKRLKDWFAKAPQSIYGETAYTYYGECSVHALLERTTWHSGQHMRQIYDLLARNDIAPEGTLDPIVFKDLPMPKAVW